MIPPFRQMKAEGKVAMMKTVPLWIPITAVLVGLQLLAELLTTRFGGGFLRLLLDTIESSPNLTSGITIQDSQVLILGRLDVVGLLAGVVLSLDYLWRYLIATAVFFVLLAPFQMGVLELFWKAFRGEPASIKSVFLWYKKPALFGKALMIRLITAGGAQLASLVALIPGYVLYFFTYSGDFIGPEQDLLLSVMGLISIVALLGGMLLGFYCQTLLLPVGYCLAARPDYSIGQVIRQGFASVRGYRGKFFLFRLSFILWHLFSNMTYGTLELYVLPYITFSSLQFLQVIAVDRQQKTPLSSADDYA